MRLRKTVMCHYGTYGNKKKIDARQKKTVNYSLATDIRLYSNDVA